MVITRMLEDVDHRRYLVGTALDDHATPAGAGAGAGAGAEETARGWPLTVLDVGAGSGLVGL